MQTTEALQTAQSAQQQSKTITLPALNPGELYAGVLLGHDSAPNQHIILLPGDNDEADWQTQVDWAASIGGELPTRHEQHLLIANLKHEFQRDYYWSGEQHASGSGWAWYQGFGGGDQGTCLKDYELRARAVRRLVIE